MNKFLTPPTENPTFQVPNTTPPDSNRFLKTPSSGGMVFQVGEGLTPEQTATAYKVIKTSDQYVDNPPLLYKGYYDQVSPTGLQKISEGLNIFFSPYSTPQEKNQALGDLVAPVFGATSGLTEAANGSGEISKIFLQNLADTKSPNEIFNLIKNFNVPSDVITPLSEKLASANTVDEVKNVLLGDEFSAPTVADGNILRANDFSNPVSRENAVVTQPALPTQNRLGIELGAQEAPLNRLIQPLAPQDQNLPKPNRFLSTSSYPKSISSIMNSVKPDVPSNIVRSIPIRSNEISPELIQRAEGLAIKKETIINSPYQKLLKYISKNGDFKGELPEVTGKGPTEFGKKGDVIIQDVFSHYKNIPDSEQVRAGMETYLTQRKQFFDDLKILKKDVADFKEKARNSKIEQRTQEALDRQAKFESQPLFQTLSEIEPPETSRGVKSPKLDFSIWKDVHSLGGQKFSKIDTGVFKMARDNFARNIEKVAPKEDVAKLVKFIVDPVNKGATEMVRVANEEKIALRKAIVEDLGIRLRSVDDYLSAAYSQGYISEGDFMANAQNPDAARKAIKVAQDYYSKKINQDWNPELQKYGYDPIPVRPNYLPHMADINFWTENFGFLKSDNELPTSVIGKTEHFKPGKIFSPRQLKRMGNASGVGLIDALNKYADSVNKQIYSIKPLSNARAFQKYFDLAIKTSEMTPEPLKLQNFKANLTSYIDNNLAEKRTGFDRDIKEKMIGNTAELVKGISNKVADAILLFNPAVAMTHLVSTALNAGTVGSLPLARGLYETMTSPFKEEFSKIDGLQSDLLLRRYPIDQIDSLWYQDAKKAGGFLLKVMDQFKVKLSVASKYYEMTSKGMPPEQAMNIADKYGARIAGDPTWGNKPNLFMNRNLSAFTKFQLGMNDAVSVLTHDIPYGGEEFSNERKLSMATKYIKFAVYAFLLDQLYDTTKGQKKGIDPIDWFLTIAGLNNEGRDKTLFDRLKLAGTDIGGDLPFINFFTGNFVLSDTLSTLAKSQNLKTGILNSIASIVPGGAQIKKTVQGVEAYNKGEARTPSGKTQRFPIKQNFPNFLRSVLFGPNSVPEATQYFNSIGQTKSGSSKGGNRFLK